MAAGYRHYCLDTSVLLHIVRGKELADYIERQYSLKSNPFRPLISVVSLGELYTLARRNHWGGKKLQIIDRLEQELIVVDINQRVVLQAYAEVACAHPGKTIGQNDYWIAATAKVSGTTLLTTDKHFRQFSPDLIDLEWIDQTKAGSSSS